MVIEEKLVYSVWPEAGHLLGVSRAHIYKMVKEERLPVLKLGRRYVIPRLALLKMLESITPGINKA